MHQLVFVLATAESPEEAVASSRSVFEELLEDNSNVIDYYVTFEDPNPEAAARGRLPDFAAAAQIGSDEGDSLLERAWTGTNDPDRISFEVGEEAERNDTILYTEHGTGITSRDELDRALDQPNLWIVPADVHF